ncbi:sodium-dependent bicarbonate transport family permease [Tuwongella immobilis]|uniref:Sodium-dependent bicarbonate transport family permease n=1 Tax=Tuwongella immobilis TaxID=692036 RepID=A0A6C2YMA3_9BACT|nr:sodium-dependent bicarbonate transport family permease [Tuwongella immobilis]VIP02441.1 Putative permease OS=Ignavibacterium album (strain DSM 19864 / JCM 16511 / NBRC 101810 / Mat9-16) GN=IALB_2624 PE=4 SV=1: DUF897 [Tuwongella immobilis]VTS01407.1 Putative permease OS=Ignavibacterium album (strain DSM 19864 / JCM 16511 / NBRC 101810 / Mat9-16) GN=IALB_2624 PE=4 SV=1: DUF897 [Tuwongella immobilis]
MKSVWIYLFVVGTIFMRHQGANAEPFFLEVGPAIKGIRELEVILKPSDLANDPTRIADFANMKAWAITGSMKSPQPIQLALSVNKLRADINVGSLNQNAAVVAYAESIFGVEQEHLKRFFSKSVIGEPEQLNRISPNPIAALEIVPFFEDDGSVRLTAYEHGVLLRRSEFTIIDRDFDDHGSPFETWIRSDESGAATWVPPGDGEFSIFLRRSVEQLGQYNQLEYARINDEAVLTIHLPLVDSGRDALIHRVKIAAIQNFLGPLVLFFFLGFFAKIVGSPIEFPEMGYRLIVIYLLLSIGYEGGHQLRADGNITQSILPLFVGFMTNVMVGLSAILILHKLFRFDTANSCALGALYGSDSAGLFAVALSLVRGFHLPVEGFMSAMLAVMELPGILVGIILFRIWTKSTTPTDHSSDHSLRTILFHELRSPGVLLLLGGIIVGYITVPSEYIKTEPFFIDPFKGVMCLFLFENGLKAGSQLSTLRNGIWKLALFGICFPLIAGALGLLIAKLIGLSVGSAILFAILASAPSNIAAPAAMRIAIPQANPGIYFTTSLGISFPTLVILGVPLFYILSQLLY